MMATLNGCHCHRIPQESRPCLSCRGRQEQAEAGHRCMECGVGLFDGVETQQKRCSECQEELGHYW